MRALLGLWRAYRRARHLRTLTLAEQKRASWEGFAHPPRGRAEAHSTPTD